ncbi:hypothetical protein [Cupriavidus sp. CP313]
MNLTGAAAFIGISPKTLRLAVERGEVAAEHPLPNGPWIFNRHSLDADRVAELVRVPRRGAAVPQYQRHGKVL